MTLLHFQLLIANVCRVTKKDGEQANLLNAICEETMDVMFAWILSAGMWSNSSADFESDVDQGDSGQVYRWRS